MEICNRQDRLHDVPSRLTENGEKLPREEVSTLRQLIDALHEAFQTDHVDIDHVQDLMTSYNSDPAEWKKFAKFDRYRYNANFRSTSRISGSWIIGFSRCFDRSKRQNARGFRCNLRPT